MNLYLIAYLILVVLGAITLPFVRRRSFAPILWMSLVASGILLLHAVSVHLAPLGGDLHTPNGGFVAMANMFFLLSSWPLLVSGAVSLVMAIIAFPLRRTWNLTTLLSGLIGAWISSRILLQIQTPATTIRVIDEQGQPIAGVVVHSFTHRVEGSRPMEAKTTDARGLVTMHVPPAGWYAAVSSSDGRMTSSVSLERVERTGILVEFQSWRGKDWGKVTESLALDEHRGKDCFELRVRAPDELTSPWLAGEIHRLLQETLTAGRHAQLLPEMCNNLESFGELETLREIALQRPELGAGLAEVLVHDASVVLGFRAGMLVREGKPNHFAVWPFDPHLLYQWRGLPEDSNKLAETDLQLEAQLQQMIDQLLSIAEPLWPKQGPVVFTSFRQLSRPAVPKLLRAMEVADGRVLQSFQQPLQNAGPAVDQVYPFFQSANPAVAIAAIATVKERLSLEEAGDALSKLRSISDPKVSRIMPDPTFTDGDVFTHKLNEVLLQEHIDELIKYLEGTYFPGKQA